VEFRHVGCTVYDVSIYMVLSNVTYDMMILLQEYFTTFMMALVTNYNNRC